MPTQLDQIAADLAELKLAFVDLNATLRERCADHQRQLNEKQQQIDHLKKRDGNGRPSHWTPKLVVSIAVAVGAIAAFITELIKRL